MDSISQLALGATLGELALGRHLGRRALLLGAILGTLPDLDIVVRYSDAVEGFTRHRSWSHSLPVLLALSFPIALALRRYLKASEDRVSPCSITLGRWFVAVALILMTHPLLDAFTLYGTQLFWPFPVPPVAIGSVYIVDPLYTVPLVVGMVWAWRHRTSTARRACQVGVLLSSLYLCLTLISQAHARQIGESALVARGLPSESMIVAPFPFSLLWRFVGTDGDIYYEGWYSMLDRSGREIQFSIHERNLAILEPIVDHWPVRRLDWFTRGRYSVSWQGEELVMTDLRMGAEPEYVFSFAVATSISGVTTAIRSHALPPQFSLDGLRLLIRRYLNSSGSSQVPES